jgi:hypothetical protein
MMIRRTLTALLVALVASFALSAPADAAQKKTARARAKHSSRATAGATTTKPTVKKKRAVRKKAAAKSGATAKQSGKKAVKRRPTTKPH